MDNVNKFSPSYLMKLIEEIESVLWEKFQNSKYKKVLLYIKKWQQCEEFDYQTGEEYFNFNIVYSNDDTSKIDLTSTLASMDEETLFKIAIDIGVEIPFVIPCIPTFRIELKENFKSAFESFEEAYNKIEDNPNIAVGLANSTLESLIKEIIKEGKVKVTYDEKKTLYALTQDILKEFSFFPSDQMPKEIKTIGSSLLNISKNIESLRSDKTLFHGKTGTDHIVNDPLYAYFIVNCISTLGLFINDYYNKTVKNNVPDIIDDDVPF